MHESHHWTAEGPMAIFKNRTTPGTWAVTGTDDSESVTAQLLVTSFIMLAQVACLPHWQ